MELFSEVYGTYYHAVARLLEQSQRGTLSEREMAEVIRETAFEESVLAILPRIKSGEWKLFAQEDGGYAGVTEGLPRMPLTTLEKRWMKAIALDPRFGLFCDDTPDWPDVEPLHLPDDICWYDRARNGDDYADEGYRGRFRTVLCALREKRMLRAVFVSGKGQEIDVVVYPYRLEYSMKDDKFRLLAWRAGEREYMVINLGRMTLAEAGEPWEGEPDWPDRASVKCTVELELIDERNAMERAMLHFASYEKRTEKTGENEYRMWLSYDKGDETEVLIRVLSFGPFLKAVGPGEFVELVRERLRWQMKLDAGG